MEKSLLSGLAKGHRIKSDEMRKKLDEYYKLRGWNLEGKPMREKLDELGQAELI